MCCCCCGCDIPDNAGLKKRKGLTDSLCVLFLMICLVGWIAIGIVSFFLGSPIRYWNGFDSFGNTCDMAANRQFTFPNVSYSARDTTGLKNVLFFEKIGQSHESLALCVKECPVPLNNASTISTVAEFIEYTRTTGNLLCHYSLSAEAYKTLVSENFSPTGPCPKLPIQKSVSLINRCVPLTGTTSPPVRSLISSSQLMELQSYITGTLVDLLFEFLNQAYSNELAIGISCAAAIVFSIIMMFMLHCIAYVFTYFILFGVILGSCALAALSWIAYANDYRFPSSVPIPSFVDTHSVFLALGIICTCAAVLILLLVIFLWRRILLVCAIFREVTRCLSDEPAMLLLPFKQVFLIAGWLILSTIVFFSMFTTDNHSVNSFGFVEFWPNEIFRYLIIVHSIMVIWMFFFIIGIQNMATSAATTVWYFTPKKCRGSSSALLVGVHLTWCYHIGSVAFASIIHALFFILLLTLRIVTLLAKKQSGSNNAAVNCCLRCLQCCVACCWRIYNMVNDYAYPFIAMYGKNFCVAANMAFDSVVRHPLHVASIASIGSACIFLCRLLVATATTACTELYLTSIGGKTGEETWFCAVLIFCISFLIASATFDLYSDMLHSLFVCFVRDTEDNDGSAEKPFYMSRALMKFIDDVNTKVYNNEEPMSWGTIARENSPLRSMPHTAAYTPDAVNAGDHFDTQTLLSKHRDGYFRRE